jgi:hypothetical protein
MNINRDRGKPSEFNPEPFEYSTCTRAPVVRGEDASSVCKGFQFQTRPLLFLSKIRMNLYKRAKLAFLSLCILASNYEEDQKMGSVEDSSVLVNTFVKIFSLHGNTT